MGENCTHTPKPVCSWQEEEVQEGKCRSKEEELSTEKECQMIVLSCSMKLSYMCYDRILDVVARRAGHGERARRQSRRLYDVWHSRKVLRLTAKQQATHQVDGFKMLYSVLLEQTPVLLHR